MTSIVLVARSRLPVDHLEYASLIKISYRYGEFSNTGLGGEGEEVWLTESAIERFRSIAIVGVESFQISGWRGEGKKVCLN